MTEIVAVKQKRKRLTVVPCEICGTEFKQTSKRKRFCRRLCSFRQHRIPIVERFWSKVDKSGGHDSCWPWIGSRNGQGYGRISSTDRKVIIASRVAWELANGPIPDGMDVCHKCDNPPCCNESHLFIGTHSDNMKDMVSKGRATTGPGMKNPSARLTDADIIAIRSSSESNSSIARRMGFTWAHIQHIRLRKAWKHIA